MDNALDRLLRLAASVLTGGRVSARAGLLKRGSESLFERRESGSLLDMRPFRSDAR